MTREQAVRALRAKMNGAALEPVGNLASEITPERVTWVWSGRLALGKISMLDGNPGLGKSTLLLDIASRMTTGQPFPGQESRRPAAGVVIMSAEDGVADTIVPRLIVAGADLGRVYILRGVQGADGTDLGLSIPGSLGVIGNIIVRMAAQLLIIDPLMAYFGSDVDANKDQDVRRALAPLSSMLTEHSCAAWLVRHLTKGESKEAMYRGGGSIGIIGAARFGTMVAKDPDDPYARVVAPTKVNLGPEPPSLRYALVGVAGTDVAQVVWDGEPARWTAVDLLEGASEEEKTERNECEEWLHELLLAGACTYTHVMKEGRKAGFGEKTLKRAKGRIGGQSRREGGIGSDGNWVWFLPSSGGSPNTVRSNLSINSSIRRYGKTLSTKNPTTDDGTLTDLSTPIPFHSIPFHSIPFHSIPFHSIPFHSIPFHSIPFHSIPFHSQRTLSLVSNTTYVHKRYPGMTHDPFPSEAADVRWLENGWTWLAANEDDPYYEGMFEVWERKLRRYEQAYRLCYLEKGPPYDPGRDTPSAPPRPRLQPGATVSGHWAATVFDFDDGDG